MYKEHMSQRKAQEKLENILNLKNSLLKVVKYSEISAKREKERSI